MSKNPAFMTYVGLSILLGLWVAIAAYYGGNFLYHPGEIEEPAYPLVAEEEAAPEEQPAETATAEGEAAGDEASADAPAETATAEGEAAEAPAEGAGGVVAMLASADAEAGAKVSRKCAACHSFDEGGPNKVGPNLWDIVGQDIAKHEDFKYSDALAEREGNWTYENLSAFLSNPRDYAPGTKMSFAGIKDDEDLANLIAFLREQSGDPQPLP